jgi:hypothetical protein
MASYEQWVQMLAGLYRGPGREHVAWNAALLSDTIYTQPVLYEFGDLRMPVVLVIGNKDTTGERRCASRRARDLGQLSKARKGGGEPYPTRQSGRISRPWAFAADSGARDLS